MTKEEAIRELKSLAEAASVMAENQQRCGWTVSPFVFQNWILRLNRIIAALDFSDPEANTR